LLWFTADESPDTGGIGWPNIRLDKDARVIRPRSCQSAVS
jgi:hypothetical protein